MNLRRGSLACASGLAMVLVLATGCSQVIDGRATRAMPKPGTPLQWSPCQTTSPVSQSRIPKGAECAMLSVPVDYSKPDGDVAQLALLRIKATGGKIGSLVINPGWPGYRRWIN